MQDSLGNSQKGDWDFETVFLRAESGLCIIEPNSATAFVATYMAAPAPNHQSLRHALVDAGYPDMS